MINVTFRIFARFKETFGAERKVFLEGEPSIKDAVSKLCAETEGGYTVLFGDDGELLDTVLLMYNKKRVSGDKAGETLLKDGDEIILYPPVSGG
ncbi:molybdopterin converting factor small subunit [Methanomicrobium sp. W14]|uniref:MoaD/ThiS family protein n=1 Tax=Methanomicrobium sp. W14 TaxID=2817839 RepID=UPI001AE48C9F|nr:MoaD/ThiS family protein [Methanomicrobium sp. W14]MBP2134248.1 molybdopterin converting factor small subunit [Methanomicrobium sp. W14]